MAWHDVHNPSPSHTTADTPHLVRCYQDPYSRRATWEMLQQRREGRVLVLTTHFMVTLY